MKISEIQITPIKPNNGLVAFASFTIDNSIYCSSVGIITRPNGGYRLVYPSRKIANRNMNLFYPITKDCGQMISQAVIGKYEDVLKEIENDRYDSFKD